MAFTKIKTGFLSMTDTALVKNGASAKEGMTKNSDFPDMAAKVEEFVEAYDAFVAAIPPRNIRNQVNVAVKDAKRKTLIDEMLSLAYAIMSEAGSNVEVLERTGFALTGRRHKKPIPPVPSAVDVFVTTELDTLLVSCKSNKDATMYEARVSTDKLTWAWSNTETSSKVLVNGITSGVTVYVQMRMKNSTGDGGWSNAVEARLPLPTEPVIKYANMK